MTVVATEHAARREHDAELRELALERLGKKRDFHRHLFVFVVVNALLWVVWGIVFAEGGTPIPWALFPTVGWGIGVVFHGLDAYRSGFSDDAIAREMQRLRGTSG